MQRFFTKHQIDENNKKLLLPKDVFHHAIHVLRMKSGDQFELVTPEENVLICEILEVNKKDGTFKIIGKNTKNSEIPVKVTIVCGVSKGDKAEEIVKKGTQLGAYEFIFFNSKYSIAKWESKKKDKKITRLKTIAQNAAEQSHRSHIPDVKWVSNLTELMDVLREMDHKIVAYEEAAKNGEKSVMVQLVKDIQPKQSIAAFFGPEGGIAPSEIKILMDNGFKSAGLGPRILRAETAPLYLLSALSFGIELE